LSDNEVKDYGPVKAVINATVQWPDMRLSEQVKHVRLFRDKENNIVAMPVILLDPTQTGLNVLPMGRVGITDPAALNSYARVYGLPCCGWPETTLGLVTHSTQMLQKGAMLEARRTQTLLVRAESNAAGNVAIYTPAAGRRFRLLGFDIHAGGNVSLAAAGNLDMEIRDNAVRLFSFSNYIPLAVAAGANYISKTVMFGDNGYLSVANANALNLWLSAGLATGLVKVTVWITDELP
jgi:hypothetical protein